MSTRVAINGFGRVGHAALRSAFESDADIEFAAISDLYGTEALANVLAHDSVYGAFPGHVESTSTGLRVDGLDIPVLGETDPAALPWAELGVDVVLECTGRFRARADAAKHLDAGARKVIVSAPMKDADATLVLGVNFPDAHDPERHAVISNASCTTNCLAPVAKVLHETVGIRHGLMTTVHAYTRDQRLVDTPHKDARRARAAAANLVPTSTGAAKAIGLVIPELAGPSKDALTPLLAALEIGALILAMLALVSGSLTLLSLLTFDILLLWAGSTIRHAYLPAAHG